MTTDKSKNFFRVSAEDFKKIPGSPIAYWASKYKCIFENASLLADIIKPRQGLATGCNDLFLRQWSEVSISTISFISTSRTEALRNALRWFPYNKGGDWRKWAGNYEYIVDWENDGDRIRNFKDDSGKVRSRPQNTDFYFQQGITWSDITTKAFAARFSPAGFIFDVKGSSGFPNIDDIPILMGLLNSCLMNEFMKILNPTCTFQVGDMGRIPLLSLQNTRVTIDKAVQELIAFAITDWDSYETSWDFQSNPLIAEYNSGKWVKQTPIWSIYDSVRRKWAEDCEKMRQLEMSNNRIFIDAYGLQDELTSDVPWDEITLTCNPWYRYGKTLDKSSASTISNTSAVTGEKSQLQVIDNVYSICECSSNGIATTEAYPALSANFPYNKELEDRLLSDTIKEFISYAVGCLMGRYSPEKSGLILANQSNGQEEDLIIYETTVTGSNIFSQDPSTVSFSAKDGQQQLMSSYTSFFPVIGDNKHLIIDCDGVLPILDEEWFFDDIVTQFKAFVALTFGEENLSANMDFIESVLGKDIRKYFVKDFYKEHIQRYKKRPIYWLFSSPKGSFNALIYLHRYTPDTVSIVLNEYLRELMTKLSTRIKHLIEENNRADTSNADKTRNLKQIDKYTAQLAELEDYERDVIFPLAQQKIAIDLDDGVKVNYCKFGAALKKIPGLEAKEE